MRFNKKSLLLILIGTLVLFPSTIHSRPGNLLDQVKELTLDNGMKFLLLHRSGAPVFSAYIRVRAGGVDEKDSKTGIAHLLEHMAFKGTTEFGTRDPEKEKVVLSQIEEVHKNYLQSKGKQKEALKKQLNELIQKAGEHVIKEEFSQIYLRNGATGLNATTSQDLTSYFVSFPANKLKLWAYMESQRLKDPVFREFYSERDVVGEERRMRVEDSSFGKLYEAFIKIGFQKSPYRRPTIGYKIDIEKLSASDLRKFYNKYYVPSNMVGAIVGDIDLSETERVLRENFGSIRSGPKPESLQVAEPQPKKEKKIHIKFDASASLMFGYLKPKMPHPDDYTFDVLDQILCQGRTSRLYKKLVVQEKVVQNIMCSPSTPGSRLDNLFFVYATIRHGHQPEEVLRSFDNQIDEIQKKGVSPQELKTAKKKIMSQWYYDLQSNTKIARALTYFETVTGTWKYILEHPKKIESVTSEDISRIVKEYIQPKRRRVAILRPVNK